MIAPIVRAAVFAALAVHAVATAAPERKCDIGPLKRLFGGTEWLVYSCDDNQTLVFVSATGSPAMPFYFMLFPENGKYRLYGEGNGQKAFTEAAKNELSVLDVSAISALIAESKKAKLGPQQGVPADGSRPAGETRR